MGYRQHLVRSLLAIREQGGLPLRDGSRLWPEPVLVGRSEPKLREIAERHGLTEWTTDLRRGAGPARRADLLRRPGDRAAGEGAPGSHRRGQAHLHREADRRGPGRGGRPGPDRRRGRRQARRRAGQALPARPAQARPAGQGRLLRPDPVGARRVRLLGLRGRLAGGPASVLELPGGRRRRHRRGHVPALALRAGADLRAGPRGHRARHHPHRRRGGTSRARSTRRPPTTRRTASSSSTAASSRRSTPPGRCGSTATNWSSSRWTAPRAARSPACATAGSSTGRPPRSRSGTPTCRPPRTSASQWQVVPDNDEFDNGFKAQWELFLRHVVEDAPYTLGPVGRRPRRPAGRARPRARPARAGGSRYPSCEARTQPRHDQAVAA